MGIHLIGRCLLLMLVFAACASEAKAGVAGNIFKANNVHFENGGDFPNIIFTFDPGNQTKKVDVYYVGHLPRQTYDYTEVDLGIISYYTATRNPGTYREAISGVCFLSTVMLGFYESTHATPITAFIFAVRSRSE